MDITPIQQPHLIPTSLAASAVLKGFDPKKIASLDSKGRWIENPEKPIFWAVNEILFHLWKMDEKQKKSVLDNIIKLFIRQDIWPSVLRIKVALIKNKSGELSRLSRQEIEKELINHYKSSKRPVKHIPFLIILEVFAWILVVEAQKKNANRHIPEWDLKEKKKAQLYKKDFLDSEDFLNRCLSKKKRPLVLQLYKDLKEISPDSLISIPDLIAEEQRLTDEIKQLLMLSEIPSKKEEGASLIGDKIYPSTGVVAEISPALLRPCTELLGNDRIDVSSGIPYRASVIISILQDPRSTKTLLNALKNFPLQLTNIRENIIYTLGNLKEKNAVGPIKKVLDGPDKITHTHSDRTKKPALLEEQKEEALRSLGKIGLESLNILPSMIKYKDHSSTKIKTHLSWALGEIGSIQKEKHGGVSADILIALLTLIKTRNKQIFEEAVSALRNIEMPEFLHTLYLYNVGAISILGIKPAQKGLYELSETLHYLILSQGRAIMAVNGDSGTGKTYFCESILESFGGLAPKEILYLMRDRKKDQKIFNRILGINWLKKYIDPVHYQDYPNSEEDDNPEEYLTKFIEKNSDKKLIIIDGCRDRYYFQRIIDLLHFREKLDVVVNFRANFSTRRKNLEIRETALESIKTHLSFLEEPPLEDTYFYQEGNTIVYDLDNSINRRLNKPEMQELFKKRRIETWGSMIKIGDFIKKAETKNRESEPVSYSEHTFDVEKGTFTIQKEWDFKPEEKRFRSVLNEDVDNNPNLIQSILLEDLRPHHIRFYAQDQIAGIGEERKIFIFTFLDNRIFHARLGDFTNLSLVGRNIFLTDKKGKLMNVSFENGHIATYGKSHSPICSMASLPWNKLITGHEDGTILVWNMENNELLKIKSHPFPVSALAVTYFGNIYSWSQNHRLNHWHLQKRCVQEVNTKSESITHLRIYPQGRLLALSENKTAEQKIKIMDFTEKNSDVFSLPFHIHPSSITITYDGRILSGLSEKMQKKPNLAVLTPGDKEWAVHFLPGHAQGTMDCLCMGPKIISCGKEKGNLHALRFWGTEFYVKTQISKLYG
jgi:hypothetical protein